MANIIKIHEISVLGNTQGTSDKVYGLALVQQAAPLPYALITFYGPRTGPKALVTATERYLGLSGAIAAFQTTRLSKLRKGYKAVNWNDFAYVKVQNFINETLTAAGTTVAHVSSIKEQLSPTQVPAPEDSGAVIHGGMPAVPRVKPATPPKPRPEPVIERGPREIDL